MKNDKGYQLIFANDFRKLEKIGDYTIERPAQGAVWLNAETTGPSADFVFTRNSKGIGKWSGDSSNSMKVNSNSLPEQPFGDQQVEIAGIQFVLRPTPFGHLGVFAEQRDNWLEMRELLSGSDINTKILNLFAYTGGATLACALSGAEVTHVDASKTTVEWAKENAQLNNIPEENIRWVTEDVQAFVKREVRRGNKYHGIILDPPTFGRGSKKQVWKIEKDLPPLMENIKELQAPGFKFLTLSAHSQGYTPIALSNVVSSVFGRGKTSEREMVIQAEDGSLLPSGATCTWQP